MNYIEILSWQSSYLVQWTMTHYYVFEMIHDRYISFLTTTVLHI